MEDLVSLTTLATTTVATAFTVTIVQVIKPLWFLQKIDTRLMVLIISIILTQIGAWALGSGLAQHLIGLFNAFIVASASMGMYEVTLRSGDEAKKLEGGTSDG